MAPNPPVGLHAAGPPAHGPGSPGPAVSMRPTLQGAAARCGNVVHSELIMAEQEELLQQANTPLIESRALQHTVSLADVQAKAEESLALSQAAQTSAEEALRGLDTRRLGMIIALGVILITVVALVLIKRELDRDLKAQRARRQGDSAKPS